MKSISIVIPAKNEQENVHPLLLEIYQAMQQQPHPYNVVYIDDGSTDGTLEALNTFKQEQKLPLQIVRHKSSVGQSTAIASGIYHSDADWIITMDADGQNDPADIPSMLKKAQQLTEVDFAICGFRKNRKDTGWKRFQSKFANKIRSAILNDGTPDTGCGLKIFPRQTFLRLPYFDHMHRFLPALIRRLDGSIIICEVNHRPRMAGTSKYGMLNRAWVGLVDMIGVRWLQKRSKIAEYIDSCD